MEQLTNPHDKLFRETWSDVATARAFLQHYLPPDLLAKIKLDTLEIVKDSFIDPELQKYFSDLIYKTTIDKRSGYIYLLFEHKSYPERQIHLQLLEYLLCLWRQDMKQRPKRQRAGKLPVVLPLVLYHGKPPWLITRRFAECFYKHANVFQPYLPDFEYVLFDLAHYSDDEIKGAAFFQVVLLLFKHIFDANLVETLPAIFTLMRDVLREEEGLRCLEIVLRYLYSTTSAVTFEQVSQVVAQTFKASGEEQNMTIAERLRKEGRVQGILEGIKQGELKGEQKGYAKGLHDAIELGLSLKFGDEQAQLLMPFIRTLYDLNDLQTLKAGMKQARDLTEFMTMLKPYIQK